MIVYLVYDENHGMIGVYGTEESARQCVEDNSIVYYGCRSNEEIWERAAGNELVWYKAEEVIQ